MPRVWSALLGLSILSGVARLLMSQIVPSGTRVPEFTGSLKTWLAFIAAVSGVLFLVVFLMRSLHQDELLKERAVKVFSTILTDT
jgi:uncharacterized membrane protein YbhN (UPF0104 family)